VKTLRNVQNIVVSVIVTFLLSTALNFGINYLTQDNGTIMLGPTITVQGKTYMSVTISNFTSGTLDGIVLSLPSATSISELIASAPIRVGEQASNTGTTEKKLISISEIGHNRVTTLQIPLLNPNQASLLEVTNAGQKKLGVIAVNEISYPIQSILTNAAAISLIYACFYAIVIVWEHGRLKELDARLKHFDENARIMDEQTKKLKKLSSESTARISRIQVVMLARMSDYSQELRFWRDTIRKLLYGLTGTAEAGDKIVKHVTESLKTYSTRTDYPDFETIRVAAGLVFGSKAPSSEDTEDRS
jgi:hypothetical protein